MTARRLFPALLPAILGLVLLATPARAAVDIQTVTSPGGITAWLVQEPDIPFTALEIRFRGGASLDPEGREGAVNLMTALIEEGTGSYDAQGFAAARVFFGHRHGGGIGAVPDRKPRSGRGPAASGDHRAAL